MLRAAGQIYIPPHLFEIILIFSSTVPPTGHPLPHSCPEKDFFWRCRLRALSNVFGSLVRDLRSPWAKGRPPISRGWGWGVRRIGGLVLDQAGSSYRKPQNVHAEAVITINGMLRLGSANRRRRHRAAADRRPIHTKEKPREGSGLRNQIQGTVNCTPPADHGLLRVITHPARRPPRGAPRMAVNYARLPELRGNRD
jgi:hypothetical protein